MTSAYQELSQRFYRLHQLNHAMTYLHWDQAVMMPAGGSEPRTKAMAELSALHHELLTSAEVAAWLEQAGDEKLTQDERINLREMKHSWQQADCLPSSLVKAQSAVNARCEFAWRTQRPENDWPGFLQNFREVVRLSREEAALRQEASGAATPYDALLQLYCRGESAAYINEVFARLKRELPDLIAQVSERYRSLDIPDCSGSYPVTEQNHLNHQLAELLGFNFTRGRLDISAHPFSTGMTGDQRICTRYDESEFMQALLATAHETGHASYEAGLPEVWQGMPVGQSGNMAIHESQSLLFEKQLFLSPEFIRFFCPTIHDMLPASRVLNADQLWRAMSRVEPGFIRVEADEVTYPMHVILRYEIESALINGDLEADDIPDAWAEKMQAYLGLDTRDNYKDGCLQDIHWTDGGFGYFPSYTLGALNSVQLFHSIRRQTPDWSAKLAAGDTSFIHSWLQEHIWQHGSFMSSQELMQAATGQSTNADFFLEHIRERYLSL